MDLSEKQLTEIEEWARALYSPREIAIILHLDPDALREEIEDERSEAYQRFHRGRLISEGVIRKSIFDLAENGSSTAQGLALKLIEEAKIYELIGK